MRSRYGGMAFDAAIVGGMLFAVASFAGQSHSVLEINCDDTKPSEMSSEGVTFTRGNGTSRCARINVGGWVAGMVPVAFTSGVHTLEWDIAPVHAEAYPIDQFAVDIESDEARFGSPLFSFMFRAYPNGDRKVSVRDSRASEIASMPFVTGKMQHFRLTVDLDDHWARVECGGVVIAENTPLDGSRDLRGVKFTSLPYGKAVFDVDDIRWVSE